MCQDTYFHSIHSTCLKAKPSSNNFFPMPWTRNTCVEEAINIIWKMMNVKDAKSTELGESSWPLESCQLSDPVTGYCLCVKLWLRYAMFSTNCTMGCMRYHHSELLFYLELCRYCYQWFWIYFTLSWLIWMGAPWLAQVLPFRNEILPTHDLFKSFKPGMFLFFQLGVMTAKFIPEYDTCCTAHKGS